MGNDYPDQSDTTRSMYSRPQGPPAPPLLHPGDVLNDRFEIVQFLARGGMGEVYEAADRQMQGKHLALKTLRPEVAGDASMRQRFEREALLAREILHANVCPTYDLFRVDLPAGPLMFLTMKLLRGESLGARLNRLGAMTPETALPLAVQMAAALDAAHKAGVIHRDFKPGNVMLESTGPGTRVYITDFGLSREFESDGTLAQTGRLSGTLGYIAPELLQGRIASPASDVYAFGVVLHEMLTGRRPRNKPGRVDFVRPGTLQPGLPRAWDRVILGCLSYDPAQRFQSPGEALSTLDVSARSTRTTSLGAPIPRRRIVGAGLAAALAAAAAWLEWPRIDALFHPLPARRFVAVMAWPADAGSPTRSLLQGVLNGIATRLARGEAADKNLLVLTASDAGQAAPKSLPEAVTALGANLVLGAALRREPAGYALAVRVYDAARGSVLRQRELTVPAAQLSRLSERASTAAAGLLGVPLDQAPLRDQDELSELSPAAYQIFQEGVDLNNQPNDAGLDQAIEKYQKTLEAAPHFALGYASLAIAYCRKFTHTQDRALLEVARKNADLAVRYNADSAQGVFAVAFTEMFSGDTEKAMEGIAKALQLDPGNPQFPYIKARALRDLGRYDEGEAVCRDIIRVRPNFWPAYNEIGYLLSREFQYRKAAEAFGEAAAMAPRVALPLANQGTMYLFLHQDAAAEDAFRRSLQRAPNYVAYANLGNILFQRKDYRQALDYYSRARDLRPKIDAAWRNLADCYTMLGDTARALESYGMAAEILSAALRTNPRPADSWLYLAFYHAKLGRKAEAEADLETAAQKGGASLQAQLVKAQALAVLGRREEALRLVLDGLDRGLSTVDVELALDLKEVRADPRYRRRSAQNGQQEPTNHH
jgi:tetratricopeptide (TPR) repeat protein/tRNA A-37 threonylcarbamoyl transferase component Bud32